MSVVQVSGYVPDEEIGPILFTSYIYNTFFDEGKLRFLIWNPYAEEWEIVGPSAVKPLAVPPQELRTKEAMKEYHKLLTQRKATKQ